MYIDNELKLRKLQRDDLQYRVNLLNDPKVAPFINTSEIFTLEKTNEWFSKIEHDDKRYDVSFLLHDELIGMGGLTSISRKDKNAEFYIYLSPLIQGKGYGKMATYLLCKEGFETLQLRKNIFIHVCYQYSSQ